MIEIDGYDLDIVLIGPWRGYGDANSSTEIGEQILAQIWGWA